MQVCDPAEETLPYEGRMEFHAVNGPEKFLAGKTESLRDAYGVKFRTHREGLRELDHERAVLAGSCAVAEHERGTGVARAAGGVDERCRSRARPHRDGQFRRPSQGHPSPRLPSSGCW